jgi:hypothetical protein
MAIRVQQNRRVFSGIVSARVGAMVVFDHLVAADRGSGMTTFDTQNPQFTA